MLLQKQLGIFGFSCTEHSLTKGDTKQVNRGAPCFQDYDLILKGQNAK